MITCISEWSGGFIYTMYNRYTHKENFKSYIVLYGTSLSPFSCNTLMRICGFWLRCRWYPRMLPFECLNKALWTYSKRGHLYIGNVGSKWYKPGDGLIFNLTSFLYNKKGCKIKIMVTLLLVSSLGVICEVHVYVK